MRGEARRAYRIVRAFACVVAGVALAVPISVSGASSGPTLTDTTVQSTRIFTDTGVVVAAGDLVDVRAVGRIRFGPAPINQMTPAGVPWGPKCLEDGHKPSAWPLPGFACWSLIARVGTSKPFEIGVAHAFAAPQAGELFLGVNDDRIVDNSGSWAATVRVTVAGTGSSSKSSSAKIVGIAAAAAALVLVGLLIFVLLPRRRAAARRRAEAGAAPEVPAAERVPVAAAVSADILPEQRRHTSPIAPAPAVPTDPGDVNIFEVEFPDLASLRVGYNYFPEGTVLRWRVRQGGTTAATGEFVASGGGSTNHFVSILLGVDLAASPLVADVDFTWSIGGVPFGYSVRRGFPPR